MKPLWVQQKNNRNQRLHNERQFQIKTKQISTFHENAFLHGNALQTGVPAILCVDSKVNSRRRRSERILVLCDRTETLEQKLPAAAFNVEAHFRQIFERYFAQRIHGRIRRHTRYDFFKRELSTCKHRRKMTD